MRNVRIYSKTDLKWLHLAKQDYLTKTLLPIKHLSRHRKALYISYPLANDEGKALMPSSYIKRMQDLFPNHTEHHLYD